METRPEHSRTDLQWSSHHREAPTTPAFHNFIDFKKAFDRVWHAGLRQVFRSFSIEEGLVQAIQALYDNSISAVLLNSQLGNCFKATIDVCQGCLLSPILINFFPEKIMQETFHDHHTFISIGGKPINNLRFADDIDLIDGSNGELKTSPTDS